MKKIKIGLWVFTALFILIGILMAIKTIGSLSWQQTTASIISTAVTKRTHFQKVNNHVHARTDYSVTAKYRYRFQGKDYMGSRYGFGEGDSIGRPFQKRSEAVQWLKDSKYKVGNQITIYLDPEHPSESVITNKIQWSVFVPFMLALLFVILAIIVGMLEKRVNKAEIPS